jgi:CheY-like chemotaxis protein
MATDLQATRSTARESRSILLVDDDADCRLLVRDAIRDADVDSTVYEVCNGREALDFLHQRGTFACARRPNLIYLDLEMPDIDGLDALQQIKSDPALKEIPVVMMSGVDASATMRQAAAAGVNSYTLKPLNPDKFMQTVRDSTHYWLRVHQHA